MNCKHKYWAISISPDWISYHQIPVKQNEVIKPGVKNKKYYNSAEKKYLDTIQIKKKKKSQNRLLNKKKNQNKKQNQSKTQISWFLIKTLRKNETH